MAAIKGFYTRPLSISEYRESVNKNPSFFHTITQEVWMERRNFL